MARRNRRITFEQDEPGCYHCVQRVVRRARLCGLDPLTGRSFEHRKGWVQERLIQLAGLFGVEVAGFSVMGNHLHLILRNRPDVVATWTDHEVARRWLRLFPGRLAAVASATDRAGLAPALDPLDQAIAALCAQPAVLREVRQRLSSLSWFMRSLAEPIARQANREDECTGRFWEGRFKSQRLLDEAAVLACSIYVDLNPIRARLSDRPEQSAYTSAYERIHALSEPSGDCGASAPADRAGLAGSPAGDLSLAQAADAACLGRAPSTTTPPAHPAAPVARRDDWLAPIELAESAELLSLPPTATPTMSQAVAAQPAATATPTATAMAPARLARRASDRGILPMTLEKYLSLLDWTGRQIRMGKGGLIPAELQPILERLRISAESWLETVSDFGRRFHRVVGQAARMQTEAKRLGVRWLHGLGASRSAFLPAPEPATPG